MEAARRRCWLLSALALAARGAGEAPMCDLRASADYTAGAWVPAPAVLAPAADERNTYVWQEFNHSCAARTLGWAWAPARCAVDAFDRDAFLEALRDQHVLVVGDSITEKSFESLRLMVGDAGAIPDIFYDADFYGQHQRQQSHPTDKPSKCFERHPPLPVFAGAFFCPPRHRVRVGALGHAYRLVALLQAQLPDAAVLPHGPPVLRGGDEHDLLAPRVARAASRSFPAPGADRPHRARAGPRRPSTWEATARRTRRATTSGATASCGSGQCPGNPFNFAST